MSDKFDMPPSLELAGFGPSDIINAISTHGQDVVKILSDAVSQGFSKAVILEVLNLGGTVFLDILNSLKTVKLSATALVQGVEVVTVDPNTAPTNAITDQVLQVVLTKLLPLVAQKFLTPQVLQQLLGLLTPAMIQQILAALFNFLPKA